MIDIRLEELEAILSFLAGASDSNLVGVAHLMEISIQVVFSQKVKADLSRHHFAKAVITLLNADTQQSNDR